MVLSIKDRLAARKHGAKYIKLANKELTRLNTRRQVLRLFPVVDEADVEHASAKELIHQLEGMQPGNDHYDAKVVVLGEYIRHHVKEEHEEIIGRILHANKQTLSSAHPASIAQFIHFRSFSESQKSN